MIRIGRRRWISKTNIASINAETKRLMVTDNKDNLHEVDSEYLKDFCSSVNINHSSILALIS